MVFECYKSLSFSHTFCPVDNVQISSDGFVVDSVDCVSVGFLVGRCDAVHDQFVVRGFVHFVEVGCFVGGFRRIVDFPDIMLYLVLEVVSYLSEFNVLNHVVYVSFEVVEFLVLRRTFS